MRRRWLAVLLALGLSLLCACGTETNRDAPDEDLTVIGMCQVGAESDWRGANSEAMKGGFTEGNG